MEFHVVIHDEWRLDLNKQDKSVHIRFGTADLGNWEWNCVDMDFIELVPSVFMCNNRVYLCNYINWLLGMLEKRNT